MKAEKEAVGWTLAAEQPARERPALPCVVTLTRIAPGNGLDGDNNQGALKAVRDGVAAWLGVDDADPRVTWRYAQERGEWCVRVEVVGA